MGLILPLELLGVFLTVSLVSKMEPKMGRNCPNKVTGFLRKLAGSNLDNLFSALLSPGAATKQINRNRMPRLTNPFLVIEKPPIWDFVGLDE